MTLLPCNYQTASNCTIISPIARSGIDILDHYSSLV